MGHFSISQFKLGQEGVTCLSFEYHICITYVVFKFYLCAGRRSLAGTQRHYRGILIKATYLHLCRNDMDFDPFVFRIFLLVSFVAPE